MGHAMATIGRGVLGAEVFDLFDALRSYDPERAVSHLADDVEWHSPWSGRLNGRQAVLGFLEAYLGDAKKRPSFSIVDVEGDGHITHVTLSVSHRFGRAPERVRLSVLALKGTIHQAVFRKV